MDENQTVEKSARISVYKTLFDFTFKETKPRKKSKVHLVLPFQPNFLHINFTLQLLHKPEQLRYDLSSLRKQTIFFVCAKIFVVV